MIRVTIFPEEFDDHLLVMVPRGQKLVLPELESPFNSERAAQIFGPLQVRVTRLSSIGRWKQPLIEQRSALRSAAHQEQREKEAVAAVLAQGSSLLEVRTYGEAIQRKHQVDERIRSLKMRIANAKSHAYTRGSYMDPSQFRKLEAELENMKVQSQALQNKLGELRRQEKNQRIADSKQWFRQAAKKILSPEMFKSICEEAERLEMAEEERLPVAP